VLLRGAAAPDGDRHRGCAIAGAVLHRAGPTPVPPRPCTSSEGFEYSNLFAVPSLRRWTPPQAKRVGLPREGRGGHIAVGNPQGPLTLHMTIIFPPSTPLSRRSDPQSAPSAPSREHARVPLPNADGLLVFLDAKLTSPADLPANTIEAPLVVARL